MTGFPSSPKLASWCELSRPLARTQCRHPFQKDKCVSSCCSTSDSLGNTGACPVLAGCASAAPAVSCSQPTKSSLLGVDAVFCAQAYRSVARRCELMSCDQCEFHSRSAGLDSQAVGQASLAHQCRSSRVDQEIVGTGFVIGHGLHPLRKINWDSLIVIGLYEHPSYWRFCCALGVIGVSSDAALFPPSLLSFHQQSFFMWLQAVRHQWRCPLVLGSSRTASS